jgi:hypothetical protein
MGALVQNGQAARLAQRSPLHGLFGIDPFQAIVANWDYGFEVTRTENGYTVEVPVPGFNSSKRRNNFQRRHCIGQCQERAPDVFSFVHRARGRRFGKNFGISYGWHVEYHTRATSRYAAQANRRQVRSRRNEDDYDAPNDGVA